MHPGGVYIPHDETVLFDSRPSPWFVLLSSLRVLVTVLAAIGVGVMMQQLPWPGGPVPPLPGWVWVTATLIVAAKLGWEIANWTCRRYVLTPRRVLRIAGVLRRHVADIPLARLQHVVVRRSLLERLLGLGTIGFATAGTGEIEAWWINVPCPAAVLATLRQAYQQADPPRDRPPGQGSQPVVIGLAGGIGAGKTRLAQEFAKLGAAVFDADAAAQAVLDDPAVIRTLTDWFGRELLDVDGRINRAALADLIFRDEAVRRRVESLVHPRVRQAWRQARARAQAEARSALVLDAPLLFEAGLDAECHAIVFVDAPQPVRLARVAATRGWDAAELARRQAVQMPEAEKRRRSHVVISNTGDEAELARQARQAYNVILSRREAGEQDIGVRPAPNSRGGV